MSLLKTIEPAPVVVADWLFVLRPEWTTSWTPPTSSWPLPCSITTGLNPAAMTPRDTRYVHRVVIVGPTSAPWAEIADSVEDDLRHLQRPGLKVSYVSTGRGPVSIRSTEDELAAAPHVVETVTRIADSCDAIVVDCTGDPGVAAAREIADVPVVGAGEAMRRAADRSPAPVAILSADELRAATVANLPQRIAGAATVVVGATGWREGVQALRLDGAITVIEPLEAAIDWCVELLDHTP